MGPRGDSAAQQTVNWAPQELTWAHLWRVHTQFGSSSLHPHRHNAEEVTAAPSSTQRQGASPDLQCQDGLAASSLNFLSFGRLLLAANTGPLLPLKFANMKGFLHLSGSRLQACRHEV